MADHHDAKRIELRPAGANRAVVAKELVAVQFDELVEDQFEIVGGHRPLGMPRDLDRFPGLQLAENLLLQVGQFAAEAADFVAHLACLRDGGVQFRQPGLQLVNRTLERQTMGVFSHERA